MKKRKIMIDLLINKKRKKSRYTTEKELQIAYEKKFLENINKNYSGGI